jgi:hypothetical protein
MIALILSKIRTMVYRRIAISSLHYDSSLTTQLKHYNHYMVLARAVKAQAGAR